MCRSPLPLAWVLIFLVIVVLILQVVHLIIFSYLETLRSERVKTALRNLPSKASAQPFPYFHMDTRGSYQIYYSVVDESEMTTPPYRLVTMVTHCSSHNLHYLPILVDHWRGPISLAVFTSVDDFHVTLRAIHSYVVCYPNIQQYVQFHIVLPLAPLNHILSLNFTHNSIVPCQKLTSYLDKHIKTKNYALTGVPYPNNLLRNVGRLKSRTKFHLVNDIDILPNPGISEEIDRFLETEYSEGDDIRQTAFVLPVFEVEESSSVPKDKLELVAAVRGGSVRQFYAELCYRCHSNTDYDQWLLLEGSDSSIRVAFWVDYHPMWEPFVITHRSAPLYEERFKQYGYNRISHVCELHMAGFTFAVLDSGFLSHQGFKRRGNFHTNKDDENAANRALYQEFMEELHVKYPDFSGSCRDPV